jgi:hypothetical protein
LICAQQEGQAAEKNEEVRRDLMKLIRSVAWFFVTRKKM